MRARRKNVPSLLKLCVRTVEWRRACRVRDHQTAGKDDNRNCIYSHFPTFGRGQVVDITFERSASLVKLSPVHQVPFLVLAYLPDPLLNRLGTTWVSLLDHGYQSSRRRGGHAERERICR